MREINSYFKDRLAEWFREHTGEKPKGIEVERSHRDKYHTNIRVKMPPHFRQFTKRRDLVLPIRDAMIDGIANGFFPPEILNMVLGGALHKAGWFHPSEAQPEIDKFLY